MFGILLLYFIWKYFSDLALKHRKSNWTFGLLGIATYYIGTFIGGLIIGLFDLLANTHYVEETSDIILNLISVPFGLLSVWGLFKILKNQWEAKKFEDNDSLDNDLLKSSMED